MHHNFLSSNSSSKLDGQIMVTNEGVIKGTNG